MNEVTIYATLETYNERKGRKDFYIFLQKITKKFDLNCVGCCSYYWNDTKTALQQYNKLVK